METPRSTRQRFPVQRLHDPKGRPCVKCIPEGASWRASGNHDGGRVRQLHKGRTPKKCVCVAFGVLFVITLVSWLMIFFRGVRVSVHSSLRSLGYRLHDGGRVLDGGDLQQSQGGKVPCRRDHRRDKHPVLRQWNQVRVLPRLRNNWQELH